MVTGYVDDTTQYGSIYADLLEYVPDLTFPMSVATYSKMRTDPQLQAILSANALPIQRASYALDPAGCRDEVVRLCADDTGIPIMGEEDEPGPHRRRGVTWAKHVRLALLRDVYGFYPLALEAKDDGTRTHLVGLYERLPHTIDEIKTDESTGELLWVKQYSPAGRSTAPQIPRDQLLWYVRQREGANWTGRSLLRPAFGPWLLKHEMWRVHATSNRRNGAGMPINEALPGSTPTEEQMINAAKMAQAVRVGDKAGGSSPPGFTLRFKGVEGALPDTLGFIRYLDQQMSRMALAGMLDLGDTPNGSRALGAEFVDLFLLSLQASGDELADQFTSDVLVRIVDWNWGEDEPVPRLVLGDVGADTQVTAEALQLLLTAGALSADPALEEYVRRAYKLPERTEPPPPPPSAAAPSPGSRPGEEPSTSEPPPFPAAAARRPSDARPPWRRDLTPFEVAAATDFGAIQGTWVERRDSIVDAWRVERDRHRASLVEQVRDAAEGGSLLDLNDIAIPGDDKAFLFEMLSEQMRDGASDAADAMIHEAALQGVPVKKRPMVRIKDLSARARVTTDLLAEGFENSAVREAMRAWNVGTPSEIAASVDEHLARLSDQTLKDQLGAAITSAQAEGRLAAMQVAPKARYAASELMDSATCDPCSGIDGHEYASLDEAMADYGSGGYRECEGGARCRGIVVAVWPTEEASTAPGLEPGRTELAPETGSIEVDVAAAQLQGYALPRRPRGGSLSAWDKASTEAARVNRVNYSMSGQTEQRIARFTQQFTGPFNDIAGIRMDIASGGWQDVIAAANHGVHAPPLFRAMSADWGDPLFDQIVDLRKGSKLDNLGISSFSSDSQHASNFVGFGDVDLFIRVDGARGLPIEAISNTPYESEWLMDGHLEITDVDKSDLVENELFGGGGTFMSGAVSVSARFVPERLPMGVGSW